MNRTKLAITAALVAIGLSACSKQAPETGPQLITEPVPPPITTTVFINADVVTVNESQPVAEAIAVREGNILAVGSRAEVEAAAGEHVKHRDLLGATVLPGFIDTHGHITYNNNLQLSANIASPPVGSAQTIADVLELLRAHREKFPQAPWILGFGYDDSLLAENRHPTRDELDQVSTDLPIAITHVSGHLMSCNSRCLELAGINADMPDPDGGIIRRRAGTREPDGVLEETAMYALMKAMPRLNIAEQVELLQVTQQYYASYGVTTVQDGASMEESLATLQTAADEGKLYLDVVSFPYYSLTVDGMKQHPPSRDYKNNYRIGGVKITLDGSPQGKTAWLTQPYLHPPHGQAADYAGYATSPDEAVQAFMDYAYENKVPILAHANGDAAADQMIRTIAAAREKFGRADRRPVMIHAQTVREDQIDSMVEEGIIPSYFVAHTFYWGDWHRDSVFGVERASRISPLRSSTDKGLIYTTHNDTPVVPSDMMRLIWAGVNRITRSGKVLGEAQRATVIEAIKSMTLDAAYQYFEEDSKGSIEAGKRADLVVLDKNPLKVDPMDIKDIVVLETIKDGESVFQLQR